MAASGSAKWASKPAETKMSCGRKRRTAGAQISRVAATVDVVAGALGERDVDRRAVAVAGASLGPVAGARVVRELVRREVEHARVVVEDVLRAVAVMDVDVDDGDALDSRLFERARDGDGDVVEEAEAHRAVRRRVVPGRANEAEGGIELAAQDRLRRGERAAGGAQRGLVRAGAGVSVGVEPVPGDAGGRGDLLDEAFGVDEAQLVGRSVAGRRRAIIFASSPLSSRCDMIARRRSGRSGWPGNSCSR